MRKKKTRYPKLQLDFLRLNYRYMGQKALATAMGCGVPAVKDMALFLGLDLQREIEERAAEILGGAKHIPLGTEVTQWQGGTLLRLRSTSKGIIRITRHFCTE